MISKSGARRIAMSEGKLVVEILQVDKCTYRIIMDKLVITVSTTDQSEEACMDAFALIYSLAGTLKLMSYARELARQTLMKDIEGNM
jgi:hypothetical protein